MSVEIPHLNSCFCVSLKTGSLIIGGIQFFIFLLYFVDTTIVRIRYAKEEAQMRYEVILGDMLFEHVEILQLLFSAVLLFGIIKEKSGFVVAWLLSEVTRLFDGIWNMLMITAMYFHLGFFIEQLIIFGFDLVGMWVVHSYYATMKKHKYIL